MSKTLLLTVVLLGCTAATAHAQIGTIPLFDSLPAAGKCEQFPGNAQMKGLGESRMTQFSGTQPRRTISVGLDERGRPKHVWIMAGRPISPSKSESETVMAFFTDAGRVARGDRHYFTTGTPARMSEDRSGGLFASDSAKIQQVVKAVIARCSR
jgi:hypothetical protein